MKNFLSNIIAAGLLGLIANANAQVVVFSDNMESGTNGWVAAGISDGESQVQDGGLWHLSQRWSASTNTAWYYGNESTGTVGPTANWNYGTLTSPSIDLSGVTNALLTFAHHTGGDICIPMEDDSISVDVICDNGTVVCGSPVSGVAYGSSVLGNMGEYEGPTVTVNLTEFAGQTIQLRFSATFNQWCGEHEDLSLCPPTEGYYIDDVSVVGNVEIPQPEE